MLCSAMYSKQECSQTDLFLFILGRAGLELPLQLVHHLGQLLPHRIVRLPRLPTIPLPLY